MMSVSVKKLAGPQSFNWGDIDVGIAVQSVDDPRNIILKMSANAGMRLVSHNAAKGTAQNPGQLSRWYKCHMDIEVTPAVSTTK